MTPESRVLIVLGTFGAAFLGLACVTSPAYQRVGGLPFALAGFGACVLAGGLLVAVDDSRPRFECVVLLLAALSCAGIVVAAADPWRDTSTRSWAWISMVVAFHAAAALGTTVLAGRYWRAKHRASQPGRGSAVSGSPVVRLDASASRAGRVEALALAIGSLPTVVAVLWVAGILLPVQGGSWVGLGLGAIGAWPALRILISALGLVSPWLLAPPGGVAADSLRQGPPKALIVAAAVSLLLGGLPVRGFDLDDAIQDASAIDVWTLLVILLEVGRVAAGVGLLLLLTRRRRARRTRRAAGDAQALLRARSA